MIPQRCSPSSKPPFAASVLSCSHSSEADTSRSSNICTQRCCRTAIPLSRGLDSAWKVMAGHAVTRLRSAFRRLVHQLSYASSPSGLCLSLAPESSSHETLLLERRWLWPVIPLRAKTDSTGNQKPGRIAVSAAVESHQSTLWLVSGSNSWLLAFAAGC